MSTLSGSTKAEINNIISSFDENTSDNSNIYHSHNKYVLRHNNLLKHRTKCKVLRKKLKKYKLRKDGVEDQDVLNVSEVFHSSLLIKSPDKRNCNRLDCKLEGLRPKNYLFKMARRKHKAKAEKLNKVSQIVDTPKDVDIANVSPGTASQEQKKTNAFKLMMDSRNKSIGGNSPGKEKNIDSSDLQEITDKKTLKAKRNLVLQKMAEAKGALEKIEMEEFQEKCIQRKMEKRAERLKEMITNKNRKTSNGQEIVSKQSENGDEKSESHDDNVNNQPTVTNGVDKPKTMLLFNIFSGVLKDPISLNTDKKPISKEDEEFLKKLSPSLKKKENMLSYFKKIEKESEPTIVEIDPGNNKSPIIKVKFTTKSKKKKKTRKLSLKKEETSEDLKHNENKSCTNGSTENYIEQKENNVTESRKRKRKDLLNKKLTESNEIRNDNHSKLEEGRPKRHVRRPEKYIDEVQLSSSDEELYVFTPKKKRHLESKEKTAVDDDDLIFCDEKPNKVLAKSKKAHVESKQKNSTKLAPIFATKPLLNQEQLEARQKFLYSGVPDQLKKITAQQNNTFLESSNCFPTVVHVQQTDIIKMRESNKCNLSYSKFDDDQNEEITLDGSSLFHRPVKSSEKKHKRCIEVKKDSVSTVLQSFKESYPKFPVYRTYKLLKSVSKGDLKEICTDFESSVEVVNGLSETINEDPEHLNWTVKYKPMSTKLLLGNFESIRELKKWLQSWTENHVRVKNTLGSDSSDFYDSDTDSKDSIKTARNLLILTGPLGSGKTCSVYSVAAELAMKVIEVNASSKRTGKMMLQDLQEATQSHKVNRDKSQKSQEVVEPLVLKTYKRKGRPKKLSNEKPNSGQKKETLSQQSSSQEVGRTAMSLILIDDADIVFDQDDGFSSAISQLVQSSKRPVVLVTASLSCPHLQRFLQFGKVIKMRPLSPKMLGTWLDLLCLADSGTCWPGLGAKFLDYFKGDIRKTINNLQFYMTTQESAIDEAIAQNSDMRPSLEDETSCTSWTDSDRVEIRSVNPKFTIGLENEIWKSFVLQQSSFLHSAYSLTLMDLWWNIPQFSNNSSNIKLPQAMDYSKNKQTQSLELKAMADILDTLSVSDYFSQLTPDTSSNISSLPWYTSETDSVSENENSNCYSKSKEIHNEIVHHLTITSVLEAQKVFGLEKDIDIQFPDMAAQR